MPHNHHKQFARYIKQLPTQISQTASFVKEDQFVNFPSSFQNIVLTGMGGSAISGDLLEAYLAEDLKIPFLVNRNYTLPNFVGADSLILAVSYSGNTEETLSSTRLALGKKAPVVGIASGGELEKLAKEHSFPFIKIPSGYPPRQALGYIFFSLLHLLEKLEIIPSQEEPVSETIRILEQLCERNDPQKSQGNNLSNHIAQYLYKKVPILYTATDYLQPVLTRWRNQFNENSKVLAFSNVIPEMNHNEIMGWEAPKEVLSNFSVLFLRDSAETPRNKKRLEIVRDILHKNGYPIFEVFGEGKSKLAKIFSQIYIGDWVSFYLALLYGKDPEKIDSIQYLKNELSRLT